MAKTERIDLRVSKEEKSVLVQRAHKKNLNLTDYIFYCIMQDIVKEIRNGDVSMEVQKDIEIGSTNIYLSQAETTALVVALDKIKSSDPILKKLMRKLWNG